MDKTFQDLISEAVQLSDLEGITDDVVRSAALQIKVKEDWMPITPEVWRSWTGRRMALGREYHGPIYSFEAAKHNEDRIYTGKRECNCGTCQEHVLPEMRPN